MSGGSPDRVPLTLRFSLRDDERVALRRHLGRWRWRTAAFTAVSVAAVGGVVALDEVHDPLIRVLAVVGSMATAWGAVWRLPALQVRRVGPAAEEELRVGPDGLVHVVGGVRSDLPWSAVHSVDDVGVGWVLPLSVGQGLLVPRRAAPEGFGARVAAWRRGEVVPVAAEPPAGFGELRASYVATEVDYLAFARRLALRRRPVWAMPVGAFVVLAGALAADRGLDAVGLVALAVWAGALVVSGVVQRVLGRWLAPGQVRRALARDPARLPSGPVSVGLGVGGGWLHHGGGETRFTWDEVRSVSADEAALVVLFGDDVGLVLPARAFSDGDLVRARAAIAKWRAEVPAGVRPLRDQGVMPGPFAPPDPE